MREEIESVIDTILGEDWRAKGQELLGSIMLWARKAGRAAARPVLEVWFVLTGQETTPMEKALMYGALLYVVVPGDLLPRKFFRLLGILDDGAALLYVMEKVHDKVTPEIHVRVEETLDKWFGMQFNKQA